MNGKTDISESNTKVKIFKPKAVRLCPPRRKKGFNTTFSKHENKLNKKDFKINAKPSKRYVNLNDISIEEINKDFLIYKENLEEEMCHNELMNIIKNSNENKGNESNHKIKRCKGPKSIIYNELQKESYFSSFINEFNNLFLSPTDKSI